MRDNFSCSFWFVNQIVTLVSTKSGTIVGLQTRVYIATVIVIHASAGWKAHLPSYTKWTNVYNLLFFHPSQARCLFCSPVGSILTSVAAVRVVITELVLSGCSSCALLHSWTGAWKWSRFSGKCAGTRPLPTWMECHLFWTEPSPPVFTWVIRSWREPLSPPLLKLKGPHPLSEKWNVIKSTVTSNVAGSEWKVASTTSNPRDEKQKLISDPGQMVWSNRQPVTLSPVKTFAVFYCLDARWGSCGRFGACLHCRWCGVLATSLHLISHCHHFQDGLFGVCTPVCSWDFTDVKIFYLYVLLCRAQQDNQDSVSFLPIFLRQKRSDESATK